MTEAFATHVLRRGFAGCVVSPLPAASVIRDPDGYRAHGLPLLAVARPAALIADERSRSALAADLEARDIRVIAAESLPAGPPATLVMPPDAAALMQLTSGSTGQPRGVVLSHGTIAANVMGISRALAIDGRYDVGVSWLPLHHDMGLVGVLLATVAAAPRTALLPPLAFVKRPGALAAALAELPRHRELRAEFRVCACRAPMRPATRPLDLGRWRVAGCGAEPIDPSALERFADVTAPCGFRRIGVRAVLRIGRTRRGRIDHCRPAVAWSSTSRRTPRDSPRDHVAMPTDRADTPFGTSSRAAEPLDGHDIRIVGRDRPQRSRSRGRRDRVDAARRS